jgi:hypothetical protein
MQQRTVFISYIWKEAILAYPIDYIERCIEGLRNIRQNASEEFLCRSRFS